VRRFSTSLDPFYQEGEGWEQIPLGQ